MAGIGILAVGTYLPPDIRRNDWWPAETVARWIEQRAAAAAPPPEASSAGMARVLASISQRAGDPFQGAVERRIMPDGMTGGDMELAAAEDALARAGIERGEIDLLLVHSTVPEYLMSNTACVLHHRLGLRAECLAIQVEAAAYSFLAQTALARQMITGGAARCALLVQSCSVTRLLDPADPISPVFGDAATAEIVGHVSEGRGILQVAHRADGRFPRTLIASVPGGRWYYEGRVILHSADPAQAMQLYGEILDLGIEVVGEVLAAAGCEAADVDVFAVHQGTPWLREVAQAHFGLERARSIEVFARTGNIFSSMIPLGLAAAEPGDLVLMFGGGTGQTYGAALARWGK